MVGATVFGSESTGCVYWLLSFAAAQYSAGASTFPQIKVWRSLTSAPQDVPANFWIKEVQKGIFILDDWDESGTMGWDPAWLLAM